MAYVKLKARITCVTGNSVNFMECLPPLNEMD